MPVLQMALIGLGPQSGLRVQHTDDDPSSLALLLPQDDPTVKLWLAALEEGVTKLGSNFSVAWVGYQMPILQVPDDTGPEQAVSDEPSDG